MRPANIIALPRDQNPYQELLYAGVRRRGVGVRYAGTLTGSHSLNLLLLPVELIWLRLRGFNVLHIHWTFGFRFTGPASSRMIGRISRLWFSLVLWTARRLRLRLVWTAHNVMPHAPVFDDDLAARRRLLASADLVLAHSEYALDALGALGLTPRCGRVVPHGAMETPGIRELAPPTFAKPRTVMFFGNMAPYKGVEDLLEALAGLDNQSLKVVVTGQCTDAALRTRLVSEAARLEGDVRIAFRRVPDHEVAALLCAADALVYPFRAVTTSGSVLLGLSSGRPVIVPDLPAFAALPDAPLIRYPPGIDGLRDALTTVARMPALELAEKARAAARAAVASPGWDEIAERTIAAIREILEPVADRPTAANSLNHPCL